ncbi:hypothetical protein [Neomoorella thermoacetica]|uniref:hypothetical protein n=1 Tax=Neomoorella thermoacetica TaxID=1525 RepID=UPI0030CF4A64
MQRRQRSLRTGDLIFKFYTCQSTCSFVDANCYIRTAVALPAINLTLRDYTRELLVRGVDASGAIREHQEELAAAFKMGQDLVIT